MVEDGPNLSESFISEEFPELNVRYAATDAPQGRCKVGNLGMSLARGKYLNFLDDDDVLLPNHVEVLVQELESKPFRAAYAIAEEHQIAMPDSDPYSFHIKRKFVRYKQPFNRLLLCYMNYIPIQSIMFEREMYDEAGGFDESLTFLEDWDLWLRYSLLSDFSFVPQITSVYYTPYKSEQRRRREKEMKRAEGEVIRKHQAYLVTMNAAQVNREMDYILNVFNKKGLLFYMQKVRNFLLYRDI